MHRQIAGKLTCPVTKWIVLIAWVAVFGVAGMFASKLTDVQDNEASSWLPASAESTKALDKLAPFQDENDIPTTVVYHRDGGLTQDDLTAIQGQVAEIGDMDGVTGDVQGPFVSDDGVVAQTIVTFNFGKNGWNDLPDTADALRNIAQIDGVDRQHRGSGRSGRRLGRGVRRCRRHTALLGPRHRHPDPAVHLPQPGPVDPADLLRGGRPVHHARL